MTVGILHLRRKIAMPKVLIALNDSPSALNAVEYVARQFAKADDVNVNLVHVLPNLPAVFWDEGHILSDREKQDRRKMVDAWLDTQRARIEPLFQKAVGLLTGKGMAPANIGTTFVSDSTDAADSILEEARDGKYEIVVVGRSHHSPKHLLGAIAGKIANHGSGLIVTIVE